MAPTITVRIRCFVLPAHSWHPRLLCALGASCCQPTHGTHDYCAHSALRAASPLIAPTITVRIRRFVLPAHSWHPRLLCAFGGSCCQPTHGTHDYSAHSAASCCQPMKRKRKISPTSAVGSSSVEVIQQVYKLNNQIEETAKTVDMCTVSSEAVHTYSSEQCAQSRVRRFTRTAANSVHSLEWGGSHVQQRTVYTVSSEAVHTYSSEQCAQSRVRHLTFISGSRLKYTLFSIPLILFSLLFMFNYFVKYASVGHDV